MKDTAQAANFSKPADVSDFTDVSKPTDIFIVGLGIRTVSQLTMEAISALKLCQTVFTVDHGLRIIEYIESLGPKVINLIPEYRKGTDRLETYKRMVARVVDTARSQRPTAFATYGHPNWLVFPTELICDAAETLGLNVRLIPGISSIDMLLSELRIDPAIAGLQAFEASMLYLTKTAINPKVPCFILQANSFLNPYYGDDPEQLKNLSQFVEYLKTFYPADHLVVSLYASMHHLVETTKTTTKLEDLAELLSSPLSSGTIYIAPIQ